MTRVALLGDGIPNGTAISLTNTGLRAGIPIDVLGVDSGCTLTADTGKHFLGNASLHVTTVAGGNCWARYKNSFRSAGPNQVASIWVYFTAIPTSSTSIFEVTDASIARICEVRVISTGKVQAYDSTGTSRVATTTSIALNQWVRIDLLYTPDATAGSLQLKLYNTPTSSTPTESPAAATGLNLRTNTPGEWFIGTVNNSAAAQNYWIQAYLSDVGPAPFGSGFVLSGWVGNVAQTSATVAARVVGAGTIRLKVSTTSDLATSPVYSSAVTPDSDGVAMLAVSGLTAGTRYYFGYEVDGLIDSEMNGQFQTMPASGAVSFSFGAGSCAKNNSDAAVFDQLRNYVGPSGKPLLFFQHLGDLHYRDLASPDPVLWHGAMDHTFTSNRQNKLFRSMNIPYTWSDHDFSHPNTDGAGAGGPGAQAVYRSRVPHYPLVPVDGKGIYHSFGVGNAILCIVTDGRSYMDDITKTDDASKTKLGAAQLAWLKGQLSRTDYPVKIWFHEDSWNGRFTYSGDDTWSAYTYEREDIAAHIVNNSVRVAYVSGDLHVLAADDGTNSLGHMPLFVVSPLDNTSYLGNGAYTEGTYPTYDSVDPEFFSQAGVFDVTWDGSSLLSLAFKGIDSAGTTRLTKTLTWTIGTGAPTGPTITWTRVAADGSETTLTVAGVWDGTAIQLVTFDSVTA